VTKQAVTKRPLTKNVQRYALAGLTLAVVLGFAIHLRQTPVRAQAVETANAPETQAPQPGDQETDENDAYRHSAMVVKLGGMMGMDREQSATVFELANFLLFAAGVGWVIVKTVPKMLRDRSSAIQKHLVDARTATEEASARLSSVEDRLGKLDGQIAAMRAQAEQDSARDEQRIKASVEEEKRKILAAADQEIAAATNNAQKQLQQYAAELAIEQAARKLVVSAETDRLLVQSFAQRLAGDETKKGQN
jgi:F-type H+-transporting ATPase subunit b